MTIFCYDCVQNINWKLSWKSGASEGVDPTLLSRCPMSFSQKGLGFSISSWVCRACEEQLCDRLVLCVGLAAAALGCPCMGGQPPQKLLQQKRVARPERTWCNIYHRERFHCPCELSPCLVSYGCGNVPLPPKSRFEVVCAVSFTMCFFLNTKTSHPESAKSRELVK